MAKYNIYLHYCNGILQLVHQFTGELSAVKEVTQAKLAAGVICFAPGPGRNV